MTNPHPNPTEENGPTKLDRREFLTASTGLIAAPLLAGVAAHAQTGATAAQAGASGATGIARAGGSQTMRALQMTAFRRPLQVTEIPIEAPVADGAVIRVEACGVCRSDWHFWNEDWTWMGLNLDLPVVLGHELLALVAAGKLDPARLVTRQLALEDVTDTLQRMTSYDTVGFEVITRFT